MSPRPIALPRGVAEGLAGYSPCVAKSPASPPMRSSRVACSSWDGGIPVRDLTQLPHLLDREAGSCRAIVETPKGNRAKYDYDPETDLFELAKVLPDGMSFPVDFGFVPSTLCDDGDPLDVMILGDEPSPVGVLLRVRLIGVLEAEEHEAGKVERNDRLLAVPVHAHLYASARNLGDLEPAFLENVSQFWIDKARREGKDFRVIRLGEPSAAIELVRRTAKAAKKAA
jgi:inorganic pyrophosphatase